MVCHVRRRDKCRCEPNADAALVVITNQLGRSHASRTAATCKCAVRRSTAHERGGLAWLMTLSRLITASVFKCWRRGGSEPPCLPLFQMAEISAVWMSISRVLYTSLTHNAHSTSRHACDFDAEHHNKELDLTAQNSSVEPGALHICQIDY